VTKLATIAVEHVDHEADLCGGYRRGVVGTTNFALKAYRIDYDCGSLLQKVELLM
jgi:hypothetical protein